MRRAQWTHYSQIDPITHDEYLLMRTARLTMMQVMLCEIPGVDRWAFPSLWYIFETMGQLLDALTQWPHWPLEGQMEAAYQFFFNPPWLPIDIEPFPIVARRPLL